jgi:hypothetical protein
MIQPPDQNAKDCQRFSETSMRGKTCKRPELESPTLARTVRGILVEI